MRNVRRYYELDAIYFITAVTRDRSPVFQDEQRMEALFDAMRCTRLIHPFHMLAYAALWDHIHLLIRPAGDVTFSQVMHSLKRGTTFRLKALDGGEVRLRLWQDRFWDHMIRNEDDLDRHLDYTHYNPVKHGYVPHPEDWPRSSYGAWVERGGYDLGWGYAEPDSVVGVHME